MKHPPGSGGSRRLLTAMAVAGVLGGSGLFLPAHGAQKKEPARGAQPLTFPVATRQVQVSVVVHDKSGVPVRDLTAADFEVFEKGKEQKIESFSLEAETSQTQALASSQADRPPTVFDNVHGRRSGVTVILIDRLNTAWEDQTYAKRQIVKFLGQIRPDDRVGLYLLESNTVRILHDVTADVASLLRSIKRYAASDSAELAASQTRAELTGETDVDFDAFLQESARNINAAFLRRRAESTAEALVAIANHLSGFAGRKNLVWVSSAFPLTFDDPMGAGRSQDLSVGNVSQEVQRAARAMSEAGVAVYPVDARGIVGAFAVNPATVQATAGIGRPMSTAFTTMETAMPSIDTAKTIAENTGGRAFHSTNDLSGAIRRAIDDARVTYLLGYSPTHGEWDGRFREIKVKVKRPGVDVRHRRGYLALPLEESGNSKTAPVLTRALQSPLEATGINLGVSLERVESQGGSEVNIVIRVDPRPFTLGPSGDKWRGLVGLVIAQLNAEGRAFRDFDQIIELNLTAAMKEQLLTRGVTLSKKIRLRDDLHRLSIAVSDPPTGAVGSVIIPADKVRAALGVSPG